MEFPAPDYGVSDARPRGSKLIEVRSRSITLARLNEIFAKEFPGARAEHLTFYIDIASNIVVSHKHWDIPSTTPSPS